MLAPNHCQLRNLPKEKDVKSRKGTDTGHLCLAAASANKTNSLVRGSYVGAFVFLIWKERFKIIFFWQ